MRGWLLIQAGHTAEGMKYLTASVALRSTPSVHYHLGRAYQAQGNHDKATQEWQTARKLLSESSSSIDNQHFVIMDNQLLITHAYQRAMQAAR